MYTTGDDKANVCVALSVESLHSYLSNLRKKSHFTNLHHLWFRRLTQHPVIFLLTSCIVKIIYDYGKKNKLTIWTAIGCK